MMVSLGYPDGETISKPDYVSALARISRVLTVPLSADVVAGFGESPAEVVSMVRSVLKVGAVGINIEDLAHAEKKLFPLEKQVEKLKALKRLAESVRVPFVINARTDALRNFPGDPSARMSEALRRAVAFRDAGADCVYPMGLTLPDQISAFVKAVGCPVNVMVRKGLPSVSELQRLGVKRVSFGPSASYAAMGLLRRAAREVLDKGTYTGLVEGAISFDELNSLALREPG